MTNTKTKKRIGLDMTEGNILHQLIQFAIPLLLANLLQQLYNAVDMMVIGHYVGSSGTVGVSSGGEIATLATFLATSFGSAGQIYVAQLAGSKDYASISETIGTSFILTMLLSVVCSVAGIAFCNVFLEWLNCPKEAFDQAKSYMIVVSLGLPFVFGYNAVCGILRGMGESRQPLLFVAVAAAANVIMDILFVAVIPLKATGTAIATVVSQFASFAAAVIFLYWKKDQLGLDFSLKGMRIHMNHLMVLVRLGVPLAANSALIHGTQTVCASFVNSFGLVASATNSIGNKINKLINVFTHSVNAGAGAMVGQNIGARKFDRVNKIILTTSALAACFAAISAVISIAFPRQVFRLFTNDPEVIEFGVVFLKISLIGIAISPLQGSFSSVVTGSGNANLSFFSGILDGVILRLGLSFLLAYTFEMGILGFFYGNVLGRFGPVIVGATYFFTGKWKTRKLLIDSAK